MKNFLQTLVLVLIAGSFYIAGSHIQKQNSKATQSTITVSGTATNSVRPDSANVTVGVQTGRQPTESETMQVLNQKISSINQALLEMGIEEKDIRTESLWLNPAYDYNNGEQQNRGFEAMQNLVITVNNIDQVSTVVDTSVNAGANQVQNVQFTVSEENTSKQTARSAAIANAKQQAQTLANELGVKLGEIVSFAENSNNSMPGPYPMMDRAEGIGLGGAKAEIPEGQQSIESTVTITYEIY